MVPDPCSRYLIKSEPDILKEFELKTYEEHIGSVELIQNRTRK
jgi:hypothetical protein